MDPDDLFRAGLEAIFVELFLFNTLALGFIYGLGGGEALLLEVANGVVVSVREEVVELLLLCVVLQLVHQARSIAFHLLLRRDGEEHDLRKLLGVEGSEDAAAKDLLLLTRLLLDNYHGLVHSVHHQSHDV